MLLSKGFSEFLLLLPVTEGQVTCVGLPVLCHLPFMLRLSQEVLPEVTVEEEGGLGEGQHGGNDIPHTQ